MSGPNEVSPSTLGGVVEQILERCRNGEVLDLVHCQRDYPQFGPALEEVLPALRFLVSADSGSTASITGELPARARIPPRLGEYRILKEIGRGGMGIVYDAEQEGLGRRVALKVLPYQALLDENHIERFRREARAAARLHHTNIVPVFGVGEDDGVHYYAMQYIEGRSLDRVIDEVVKLRGGASPSPGDDEARSLAQVLAGLPSEKVSPRAGFYAGAARVALQAAEALGHAHGEGIVHRDVKPSNLLFDAQGTVWVTDFGLAKAESGEHLTHTGDIVGTLAYMAPERFSGCGDHRSDLYSLGATLYELLTLRRAFHDTERSRLIRKVLEEEPPAPRRVDPGIPRDLETIVLKAMAKDPGRRYQSAREMAEDLRGFIELKGIRARRASLPERALRWCRRKPSLATLVLVLALGGPAVLHFVWKYRVQYAQHEESQRALTVLAGQHLLWSAQKLHAEGNYRDALEYANRALGVDPKSVEAMLLRSRLLIELESLDEAVQALEEILRREPSLGDAHYLLSLVYAGRDPEKANGHRQAAEGLLAETAEAYHLRSLGVSRWEEKVRLLDLALQKDPSHFPSLISKAFGHYALGEYADAERHAHVAIGLRPQDGASWALRALARQKQGRLEEALKDHDRALTLAPNDAEFLNQRRETYRLLGDHERALDDAEACARLHPEQLVYHLHLFGALLAIEKFVEAAEVYDYVAGASPAAGLAFRRWAGKQVFDALAAGQEPLWPASDPNRIFASMRTAERYYGPLRKKGERVVPSGFRVTWSPDGKRIAYTRGNHEPPGLYSDLRARPQQTFHGLGGLEIKDLATRSLRLLAGSGKDPAWSPDGRWIVFVREPAINAYEEEEVWLAPAAGGEERRLAKGGFPSWSRDSRSITFHSREEGWIYALRIDEPGAQPERLAACPSYYPAISPDGTLLAYGVGAELVIAELPTGRQVRSWLAPDVEGRGLLVTWSPDGRELSVGGFDLSTTGLWVYELASGRARKVVDGFATLGVWSPDGRRFAFDLRGPFFETWIADLQAGKSTAESLGYELEIQDVPAPLPGPLVSVAERERGMLALLQLEKLAERPGTPPAVKQRVEEYRRAFLPDLASCASVDAAMASARWTAVVPAGVRWRFVYGKREPSAGLEWTTAGFDDSSWDLGASAFGYGDGNPATVLDMAGKFTTLYARHAFVIDDAETAGDLRLSILADDGFVAYLNGVEVGRARAGVPGERVAHDATASTKAPEPLTEETFQLEPGILRAGMNILAVECLNESLESSDLTLLPVLYHGGPLASTRVLAACEGFRQAAAARNGGAAHVAYLEARLLEAGGKLREAAAKFAESAERMSSGSGVNEVQPLAGMARCLLALKDAQAAERVLANFLERGIPEAGVSRAVWDLWLGAAAARSRDGQRSILESFPKVAATNAEPGGEIREALLDLETAGAFRLNCGGGEYRSQDGRLWRSDRFFTSGYRHHGDAYGIAITPFVEDVAGTEDDGLYQTNRWFLTEQEGPGAYRIPVSAGRYRVRLHFAEILPRAPQWRLFDLELEGKVVLSEYDPGAAGFAVAQSRAYEVEVEDGFIDLVFVSRRGHPFVSAIEVEAIR